MPRTRSSIANAAADAHVAAMSDVGSSAPLRRIFARIELPSRPEADYGDLHEAMRDAGWHRVIRGDSGRVWHLPHAVYTRHSRLEASVVRDRVAALARTCHPRPRVMVEESPASAWHGLRPVTEDDPDPDAA